FNLGPSPMAKKTAAQGFRDIFNRWTLGSTPAERTEGEKAADKWLGHHGKTRIDIPVILAQAAADDIAQAPAPPPSDPRDTEPHPFKNPKFNPLGVVHGMLGRYLYMRPHVAVVYAGYIIFTHVYQQFRIAPRLAFVSELPESGKSESLD